MRKSIRCHEVMETRRPSAVTHHRHTALVTWNTWLSCDGFKRIMFNCSCCAVVHWNLKAQVFSLSLKFWFRINVVWKLSKLCTLNTMWGPPRHCCQPGKVWAEINADLPHILFVKQWKIRVEFYLYLQSPGCSPESSEEQRFDPKYRGYSGYRLSFLHSRWEILKINFIF